MKLNETIVVLKQAQIDVLVSKLFKLISVEFIL